MDKRIELGSSRNDILRQVAVSMANFGAPMLLDKKDWETAERMSDDGILQRHQPVFDSYGYTLTYAGIKAYNKAYPPEPLLLPVKAWGDSPPKTLRGRISFIAKQCKKLLEDAYWLEIEDDEGNTESITLSDSALDKKLKELNYDPYTDDGRICYGRDNQSDAMPTCDVTGALLNGSWSGDPSALAYGLEGFAWRRSEKFQMEERDWQEAFGFIDRLYAKDREQAKLLCLIVDSCFLEPVSVNNTGLICPGGGCYDEYAELIALFDFMKAKATVKKERGHG